MMACHRTKASLFSSKCKSGFIPPCGEDPCENVGPINLMLTALETIKVFI